MSREEFSQMPLHQKIKTLYLEGTFVVGIRYYRHKVNLYLLENEYVEVFYNHKEDKIDKIDFLPRDHSRMKFYLDQIKLEWKKPQEFAPVVFLILDLLKLLKFSLKEIGHHGIEVPGGIAAVDAMISIWIIKRFKLLVCSDQRIYQIHRILEVDIVVTGSVN